MTDPVEGANLYARDEGEGPPLVLLHGLGGSHTVWNAVVPKLAREFRTIAPDLRGHGRSPAPPESRYTFEELEGDLARMARSKGLDSAHVVGLSSGALLGLKLALDRPALVRSLTLIGGAVYTDAHTRAVAERWAETYSTEGPEALALRLLKDLYYPDWIEAHMETIDELHEQVRRADYRGAALWGRQAAAFDERKRIASLAAPVLIVQAMDDQVVDASHGRILRQSISDSRIRILPQTGHLVPIERPEETVDMVRGFVREVEARRAGTEKPVGEPGST